MDSSSAAGSLHEFGRNHPEDLCEAIRSIKQDLTRTQEQVAFLADPAAAAVCREVSRRLRSMETSYRIQVTALHSQILGVYDAHAREYHKAIADYVAHLDEGGSANDKFAAEAKVIPLTRSKTS